MRSNIKSVNKARTYEGAMAAPSVNAEVQLERLVATCLLFENTFYESGSTIADNIAAQCKKVKPQFIASLAKKARTEFNLRHVPLFLLAQLDVNRKRLKEDERSLISNTVADVVRRADELAELLAIISKVNGKPIKKCLSAQVKKGLAKAFGKFNEYQLAKYNRDSEIKLRDVLFLVHRKPVAEGRSKIVTREYHDGFEGEVRRHSKGEGAVLKRLVDGTLETPDTWETRLSSGADKLKSWTELLQEGKLGPLALIRNVRNMREAGVGDSLVAKAIHGIKAGSGILPFQFMSSLRSASSTQVKNALDFAMLQSLQGKQILPGKTVLLIDVSGSMDRNLSARGESTRIDAASALAILLRETCEDFAVATFSTKTIALANPERGIKLANRIETSQSHDGTELFGAIKDVNRFYGNVDRLIVITDEQASGFGYQAMPSPVADRGYIINVAPYAPALDASGGWTRISGFSERIVDYIRYEEGLTGYASEEE